MKIKTIGAITIVMSLGLGSGHAQILPFSDDFELTSGDLDAIGDAVNPILKDPNAQPGVAATWANEKTGSSGTIDYVKALTIKGLPCKRIQYNIKIKKYEQLHRYVIDYCRVEDGTWKSYP